jgi:hypothetical protein
MGEERVQKCGGLSSAIPLTILRGFFNKCKGENLLGIVWVKNIPPALRDERNRRKRKLGFGASGILIAISFLASLYLA